MNDLINVAETKRRAVFFDRDDTLIEDSGYLHEPERIVWNEGALDALRLLGESEYLLIVVTNQSGVGRGMFRAADVHAVHERMREDAGRAGARIDAFYLCPHMPDDGCYCRKPGTGMLEEAARDYNISLTDSWLIGDRCTDIEAGARAGARTILLGDNICSPEATYSCDSISEAVQALLKYSR